MTPQRQFRLTIVTDNAAFGDEPHYELARILRDLADSIEHQAETDPRSIHWFQDVRDANGNTVGQYAEKQIDAFRD